MIIRLRPLVAACAVAVLSPALLGCSDSVAPEESGAAGGGQAAGNDGRAFGADDDVVIQAVEAALSSNDAQASWDGTTLRVEMSGSVDGPTAFLYCSTLDALLADDETGVFVYDDGEAACVDDPRYQD